ncbi:hypothetical protein D0864_15897 [Hortaea werneckii]|uniref:CSN8/PSMD8/EIF3K domain-containing protein n=1 Tax=Hortaea werneckii TaxID=91943 RepID=A0A3M7BTQ1_HORWE|nr:hypothetical protein D0864_15897 [Hortaea werneckii]RMY82516.1 hypothetical protein D0862_11988 [Hortaea werneckii]
MSRNSGKDAAPRSQGMGAMRPQARRGPSGAWSRLKPAVIDPLDVYGLPSKGETKLHEHKNQESYYTKIVERYMKFCATSGGGEELEKAFTALSIKETKLGPAPLSQPSSSSTTSTSKDVSISHRPDLPRQISSTERPNDMPNILMAMRKLREGILGSRRRDRFAQRAYIFIIHASILTGHWESYQPSLLYLLYEIHPCTPLAPSELHEFAGYYILDLACRQNELMEAFAARVEFGHGEHRVGAVLMSLVHDDWVRFWRTKRAVDGYQRSIMEFAAERMRLHALKCLGRGYMNADKGFVERCGDASWPDLVKAGVGWQLQETGNVVIRKPKPK